MSINIEQLLTPKRLYKYNAECIETALAFHNFNTELSMALYPAISYFEIVLRNKIDMIFAKYFGEDWILADAIYFDSKAIRSIGQAKLQLEQASKPVEHDYLISELSFGFWSRLFMPNYNATVWQKHPTLLNEIFNKAKRPKLAEKKRVINDIRYYRNKICHYGSIIQMNFQYLPHNIHNLIYTNLKALDATSAITQLKKIDLFRSVYQKGIDNKIIRLKEERLHL